LYLFSENRKILGRGNHARPGMARWKVTGTRFIAQSIALFLKTRHSRAGGNPDDTVAPSAIVFLVDFQSSWE
jgi:hypothetical protein